MFAHIRIFVILEILLYKLGDPIAVNVILF